MKLIFEDEDGDQLELPMLGAVVIIKRPPEPSEDGVSGVLVYKLLGYINSPEAYGMAAWAGEEIMADLRGENEYPLAEYLVREVLEGAEDEED